MRYAVVEWAGETIEWGIRRIHGPFDTIDEANRRRSRMRIGEVYELKEPRRRPKVTRFGGFQYVGDTPFGTREEVLRHLAIQEAEAIRNHTEKLIREIKESRGE